MNDVAFRYAFVLIGIGFLPVGLYHRLRSYTGEPLDRRQEGMFLLMGLRAAFLATFLVGLAWMIDPRSMAWSSLRIPAWIRWVACGIAVLSGLFWVWAVHTLGSNLTDTVVTRKEHTLVTQGPYRWVRHPFYTSFIIGIVAASVMMANWFFLIVALIGIVFIVRRTRTEEEKLVERHGDAYREFMRSTGRFLPLTLLRTKHDGPHDAG